MKHSNNHAASHIADPVLMPVRFEFTHPTAMTVCIAGTFNDWEPSSKPMHSSGVGNWWKETNLQPGNYEYCLVVDGQWIADPLAKDSVPNPFGGRNSVLTVAANFEASHLANATDLPLKNTNKQRSKKL